MKIKLSSDDKLPLNKTVKIPIIMAVYVTFLKTTNIIHKFS